MAFIRGFFDMLKHILFGCSIVGVIAGSVFLLVWMANAIGIWAVVGLLICGACATYGVFQQIEVNRAIAEHKDCITQCENENEEYTKRLTQLDNTAENRPQIQRYKYLIKDNDVEIIHHQNTIKRIRKEGKV